MRYIKLALFLGVLTFLVTGVHAKGSYIGFGIGLHPNMNDFAGTFAKDGLDSNVGKANIKDPQGIVNGAGERVGTGYGEIRGSQQQLIIPDNQLQMLQRATNNGMRVKTSGGLNGLLLSVFYESEGDSTFWRIGLNYSKRIMGGQQEASLIKIRWYKVDMDAEYMVVPFYYGFKAGVGEKGAAYGGIGLNYYWGKWSMDASSIGDFPTMLLGGTLGGVGSHTVVRDGKTTGGALLKESMTFKSHSYGFNALIGFEGKVGGGDSKLFFEMEYILSGAQSDNIPQTRNGSTASHLAPFIQYPVAPVGWMLKFGYKMAM